MSIKLKILITIKTYPLPSESYQELVCTAGVLEDGSWIRLYPIDYRYRPYWQWYSKYQWVELDAEKNDKDPRPESYQPVINTEIRPLGEPLRTKNNWAERKCYVLAKGVQTMCALEATSQTQRSLGIIRPKEVLDFTIEETDREWKPKWKTLFRQERLFGPDQKPLEKIPYKFSYIFKCEDPNCGGHKKMIEDWEIGELYRKMRDKFQDEAIATQKVKQRFFNTICASDVDIHFFVGTVLVYGSWVVLGTFWPKK